MNTLVNSIVNDISPLAGSSRGIVQFNDFDLTTLCISGTNTGYMIQSGNELSLDKIIIEDYVSSIIDGGTVIDKRYGNKEVSLNLFIQASDNDDLVAKIMSLKKELNGKNGKLHFTRAGVVYTYDATCVLINIPDFNKNVDFLEEIQIIFLITSPNAINEETVVNSFSETANFEAVINNEGTYKSYPKISIIGKGATNITEVDIDLKKVGDVTGESVIVTKTITSGDLLEIDYKEKTVKLNGVEDTNWSGFMVPMEVGMNVFDFSFTGTIDIDINILYNKVYL